MQQTRASNWTMAQPSKRELIMRSLVFLRRDYKDAFFDEDTRKHLRKEITEKVKELKGLKQ
jgi:hypothetical protein